MPAGAPIGNTNAEKWDFEKAQQLFIDAIDLTETTDEYSVSGAKVTGYKFDFIGEIAAELDTFHQIFKHLYERFPQLGTLRNTLNSRIERNCYSNTKKGIIREATGIVNLKSNWNWSDRQRIEHEGASVTIVVDKQAKAGIEDITGNE